MSLGDLEALADKKLDGTPPPAELAPVLERTAAQQWGDIPATVGAIFAHWLPELEQVYTVPACDKWGAAFEKLADARGWKPAAFFEWLGPVVPLVIASEALLTPTFLALRAKVIAVRQAKAAAAANDGARPTDSPATPTP